MPTNPSPTNATPSNPVVLPDLDLSLYAALKADIERRGVLVPVVVDSTTGEILDGRIRSEIAKEVGLRDLPTIFVGRLNAKDRADIRLGLNAYRRHLTRQQVQAILAGEIRATPHLSDRSIAGRVRCSPATVGAARRRAGVQVEHLDSKRIGKDGKSYPAAKPSVYTATKGQREATRRNLNALGEDAPPGPMSPRLVRKLAGRKERAELAARSVTLPTTFNLKNCDFRENGIRSGTIDLSYVDPPWGQGWKSHREDFARENYRILKPGGLVLAYFGQSTMVEWLDIFRSAGFTYRWTVACIDENSKGTCSFFGSFLACWRQVLLLQKGGPRFRTSHLLTDLFRTTDRDKTYHPWAQSLSEAVHLIRGLTANGASVADLTCCTGTSGVACAQIGSRKYYGVEIDASLTNLARARIADALKK